MHGTPKMVSRSVHRFEKECETQVNIGPDFVQICPSKGHFYEWDAKKRSYRLGSKEEY